MTYSVSLDLEAKCATYEEALALLSKIIPTAMQYPGVTLHSASFYSERAGRSLDDDDNTPTLPPAASTDPEAGPPVSTPAPQPTNPPVEPSKSRQRRAAVQQAAEPANPPADPPAVAATPAAPDMGPAGPTIETLRAQEMANLDRGKRNETDALIKDYSPEGVRPSVSGVPEDKRAELYAKLKAL